MNPGIDEILALDLLTLPVCEVVAAPRAGALVAYAMLQPQEDGRWFVPGFNTHPDHRDGGGFRGLAALSRLLPRARAERRQSAP